MGNKNSIKPFAVVIGLDSMNGIQTVRILAEHKVPVIAIARDRNHPFSRTKLCQRIIYADTSGMEFIEELENLGRTLDQKAVLFPCNDMNVLLISQNREQLEDYFHVMLPSNDVIEMMMNKLRFYTYAQEANFPIPRTFFLNNSYDLEATLRELNFPSILKPPISANPKWENQSKLKAYKVSTPEQLQSIYNQSKGLAETLIVQEWINGPETNLYSCNCYLDRESNPLVTFVARKLRQWPPVTGESSLGEECRDDTVLRETIRLFQSVDYRGLGYVEMKQDEISGDYFIMEPNVGRPTGRSPIAEAGGVELIYTQYCDALGWALPENRTQKYGNAKWIYLRRDFQSALYHRSQGNLTFKSWLQSIKGKKRYALFSWTDPGPFIGDLTRSVRLFFTREEREKRNYRNTNS
jgi:predicted ATP-grasp superfamily ATP-dependent carboligase